MQTIKKKAYAAKPHQEQEIVTMANKVSKIVGANRKVLSIVAAVLAGILLLVAVVSFKRSYGEQKAGPQFEAAYSRYSPRTGSNPDYAKALELFRDVHKQYPSSMSGRMAALYAANCLAGLGRGDEALKEYQSVIHEYGSDKLIAGLAYQRIGYISAAQGKQSDAIKAFEQSDSLLGPGIATVELARMYEAAGNRAEAQKKYKMIADNLPGSTWAMEAMGKVQKIQSVPAAAANPPAAGK
jgi:tetratricopeptide (TPR) repeat protein